MATEQPLSIIEKVNLRDIWLNEATDFTPWLAENISALGNALGMELELQQTEAPVGAYSLDILARDLNGNRPVIIENQLDTTNHPHLGQLLTYAAGFDANVVVWLTGDFRDEHRQALDWLNQRTGEDTLFFGVVVELWKIDQSKPAPHFNLVATPNDWRKRNISSVPDPAAPPVTARNERYRKFFQELIDTLREDHKFTAARKGQPQSWYSFTAGHGAQLTYGANFAAGGQARTELYIDNGNKDWNMDLLEKLQQHKNQIETGIGEQLAWERLENRRACRIAIYRPGSIDDDEDTLTETRTWMIGKLLSFKETFTPHLNQELGSK